MREDVELVQSPSLMFRGAVSRILLVLFMTFAIVGELAEQDFNVADPAASVVAQQSPALVPSSGDHPLPDHPQCFPSLSARSAVVVSPDPTTDLGVPAAVRSAPSAVGPDLPRASCVSPPPAIGAKSLAELQVYRT